MKLQEKILKNAVPTGSPCVNMSITEGAGLIILTKYPTNEDCYAPSTFSTEHFVDVLHQSFLECIRRSEELSVIFIWVIGTKIEYVSRDQDINESTTMELASLRAIFCLMKTLSVPLIGFVEGMVCNTMTSLLMGCDLVVASRATCFSFCEAETTGSNFIVDLQTAVEVNLVGRIAENKVDMLRQLEELHGQLRCTNKSQLASVKSLMQAMRSYQPNEEVWDSQACTGIKDPSGKTTTKACAKLSGALPGKMAWDKALRLEASLPPDRPTPPAPSVLMNWPQCSSTASRNSQYPDPVRVPTSTITENQVSTKTSYCTHTTVMVCHIPCRVAQDELISVINSLGFIGQYDFVYMPLGGKTSSVGSSNLGYAFINFAAPRYVANFYAAFEGYRFTGSQSKKKCTIKPAIVQGLEDNIHHATACQKKHRTWAPAICRLSQEALEASCKHKGLMAKQKALSIALQAQTSTRVGSAPTKQAPETHVTPSFPHADDNDLVEDHKSQMVDSAGTAGTKGIPVSGCQVSIDDFDDLSEEYTTMGSADSFDSGSSSQMPLPKWWSGFAPQLTSELISL